MAALLALTAPALVVGTGAAVALLIYAADRARRPVIEVRHDPPRTCHPCKPRQHRSLEDYLEVEQTLEEIRRYDVSGCGMKLVCDLAKLSPYDLTSDELALLELIRVGEAGRGRSGGVRAYHAAKELGEWGGRCETAFPRCPYNTQQILDTFKLYQPL